MNTYFTRKLLISIVLLFTNLSSFAGLRDEQIADVSVYAHSLNGKTAYTYTIENIGTKPILGFSIGFDHDTGKSELNDKHLLSVMSPGSWRARVIYLEDSPYYEIRWEPKSTMKTLQPRSIKSGFTVVVENANPQFLNVHWTAIIAGPPHHVSSRLKILKDSYDNSTMIPYDMNTLMMLAVIINQAVK